MYWVRHETLNDIISKAEQEPITMSSPMNWNKVYVTVTDELRYFASSPTYSMPFPISDLGYHRLTIPAIVERYVENHGSYTASGEPDFTVHEKRYLKRAPSFRPYPHQIRLDIVHGMEDDCTTLDPTMYRWLRDNMSDQWSWDGLWTFAFLSLEDYCLFKFKFG